MDPEVTNYFISLLVPEPVLPVMYEVIFQITPGSFGCYNESLLLKGDLVYRFTGNTHGLTALPGGMFISLTGPVDFPFYEVPKDHLKPVPGKKDEDKDEV